LYKGYKTHCEEANRSLASFVKYRQILNYEFNLEFFKPEKDKYHIPESHKNFTEKEKKIEFQYHREEKTSAGKKRKTTKKE